MGFFTNIFKQTPSSSTKDFAVVSQNIANNLKVVRTAWYPNCVEQIKRECPNVIVRNSELSGEGEFAANIYQLIWTCWFISSRGYVTSEKGQSFTNALYATLIQTNGENKVREAINFYRSSEDNEVTAEIAFGSDITTFMLEGKEHLMESIIVCKSSAILSRYAFIITAESFGDSQTGSQLRKKFGF